MPARTVNGIGASVARKRSRQGEDNGDHHEGAAEVREARSALQSGARRKRARISSGKHPARDRTDRESSQSFSDEDEDVEMQGPERDDAPHATQYEIMRDAGFEDLQHPDKDDRATQAIRDPAARQSNRAGELNNRTADNGILESITCINFMCHQKLFVQLGPNLNFIVGENGSGKSAILTAITLCLGGKASSTNRGGNMKAFIKEGQTEGRVSVKIRNRGDDAFQPDIYGDTITVERRFKMNGAGGFKTFSAAGALISDKKQEVTDISEYFCLQVDNPLNVLSQDNARQFLNQASAKQKYKFFLQGVQLQQLDDDYRVIEEMINSSESKEGDLEIKLETCRQQHERAKKDHSLYMEASAMRQQHKLLRQKICWAQVVEQERKITDYQNRVAQADLAIEETQKNVATKTTELAGQDTRIAQAEEEVDGVNQGRGAVESGSEDAQRKFDRARTDLEKLRNEERDAYSHASNASKDVKDYEQKVKDEEQRLQDSHGGAHTQKLQALDAARATIQQIKNDFEEAQRRIPDLNEDCDKATRQIQTISTLVTQKQGDIKGVQKRLRDLEQGQGSLYDGYEPQIRNLLRMIEEDGGFDRKPVGPIGAHIQVSKPIWSPMLEKMFGDSLNGFVVTNKRDQQRLSSMMSRLRINKSPIFIGNPRSIDTTGNEPDQNFDTVLRTLKIDDPLIRNQLIINARIEKTILIESQQYAEEVMIKSSPPRNVAACYHLLPRKGHGWTCRIAATANGVNSTPQKPPSSQQPPRLTSDVLQEMSLHKEQLGQLQMQLRELQEEKHTQHQALEQLRSELADVKKTSEKSKQREREARVDVDNIQIELDSYEGVDSRLEGFRDDLNKAREAVEHFGTQYADLKLRNEQQSGVCEQLRDDARREKNKLKEFETRLSKAENKVRRYQDSRQIIVVAKNEAHDTHRIALNEKARLEDKIKRIEKTVTEFTQQATDQCPERVHIADSETYESIEKKLESLDKSLKERERRRGLTDEQVLQRLEATKKDLNSLDRHVDLARKQNKLLKKSLQERLDKWRKFRRYISSSSRVNFMYLLAQRKFRGKLILDHENHTLNVEIEPDATRKNAAARNTKTLSGGEKSFASICLLLAIWEAMGSPIRCLDEFDVFMDNVNRAISTEMLCDAARNSVGRQFILITPNAIEGRARLDKDVTITRMTDPRQRQIADMI
ncbi:unnamed protein product [Discula destructiva]